MSPYLTFMQLFVNPSNGSRGHRQQIRSLFIKLIRGSDSSHNAQLNSRTSCCANHGHLLKKTKHSNQTKTQNEATPKKPKQNQNPTKIHALESFISR